MYKLALQKPDGRQITLYSRQIIKDVGPVLAPHGEPVHANPHMRWHPLRGEWVAYAGHRQNRTFLPPPEYNPLLPSDNRAAPTELPVGAYDVAVFDNLFPSLALTAHDPPPLHIATEPAIGKCEVVVFTQDPSRALGQLDVSHIDLVLEVWGDRTQELSRHSAIRYVLPFENRGVEVGVTLHHPHGQLYAYSVVPPIPQRITQNEVVHYQRNATPLLQELIGHELAHPERVIYRGGHAIAFIPPWARYPYEVWIAPIKACPHLFSLTAEQRRDCAQALQTVLRKYDALWQRPMPYIMAWYQAALDGEPHPEAHLHAELYPPYRTRDKLKYLAGTEIAAGMFASDVLPENSARQLQEVAV